jgi:hypothetical protein
MAMNDVKRFVDVERHAFRRRGILAADVVG